MTNVFYFIFLPHAEPQTADIVCIGNRLRPLLGLTMSVQEFSVPSKNRADINHLRKQKDKILGSIFSDRRRER